VYINKDDKLLQSIDFFHVQVLSVYGALYAYMFNYHFILYIVV